MSIISDAAPLYQQSDKALHCGLLRGLGPAGTSDQISPARFLLYAPTKLVAGPF